MNKHDTIMLACEDTEERKRLCFNLQEKYNLLETVNVNQLILLLEQNLDCIAAVVLTTSVLEELPGADEQKKLIKDISRHVPVIVMREPDAAGSISTYFQYGAADVIPTDYEPYATLQRMGNIIQLHTNKQYLEKLVEDQADMLRRSNDTMVDVLSSIIEFRSEETGHHVLRIRNYTKILLEEVMRHCPEYQLTDRLVRIISSAAALHDVGKIGVPDFILTKAGELNKEEWDQMKAHTTTGCRILNMLGDIGDEEYIRHAHNICLYHHERWDGSGYPEGLVGDNIPICAQVVGLADAYEALTSKRAYKEAFSFDKAVNMILKGECGAFSPKLLDCFKNVIKQLEELTITYADGLEEDKEFYDMTLPAPEAGSEENSLDRVRAKYYTLVHYVNGFLMEVNLTQEVYDIVYNPYPEFAMLENLNTLQELVGVMLEQIVLPEEREEMDQLIHVGISAFVQDEMRRRTYWFHYQGQEGEPDGVFEMTLLRIGSSVRKSFAVLIRKMPQNKEIPQVPSIFHKGAETSENSYICRNDKYFTFVELGNQSTGLGDYTLEDLKEGLQGELIRIIPEEERETFRQNVTEQLRDGTTIRLEHKVRLKSGQIMWVTNKSQLIIGEDGQEYLYCSLIDITHIQEQFEKLRQKHNLYATILTKTQNVLFIWDQKKDTMDFSDTWRDTFHFVPFTDKVHRRLAQSSHIHPDEIPLLLDGIRNLEQGAEYQTVQIRMTTDQATYSWYRIRAYAERVDGNLEKVTGIIANIDAEKVEEKDLREKMERDSLTQLLNKGAGRKHIEEYLSHYPDGVACAMLIIDLDNFKQVNDNFGHLFGDAVLTNVSDEIRKQFREQDIMCRIGGDEFMVLVRGVSDRRILANRCRQFIDALGLDLRNEYKKLNMGCSIGVALCPEHGKNYYDLFKCADQALYRAKAGGKNDFCFFDSGNDAFPVQTVTRTAVSGRIDSDVEPGLDQDNLVRHLFHQLYSATDVDKAINDVIAYMGKTTNVSRVYIFENTDDNKYCNNTFEWCNEGIEPEIENLQMISYETDIPGYESNFNEDGVFYCPDVTTLPKVSYDIVEPQGIKSMLHCAIRINGEFRGYIGFDECEKQRLWTKEEINTLTYFSEMLSIYLMKHRRHEKLKVQTEAMNTILDNQNAWIYIIDPDNYDLEYMNEHTKKTKHGLGTEGKCYQCLWDRTEPCSKCPAQGLDHQKHSRMIIQDQKYNTEVLAEATKIIWEQKDRCLMSCRMLPKRED